VFGGIQSNEVSILMSGEERTVANLQFNSYVLLFKSGQYIRKGTNKFTAGQAGLGKSSGTVMEWHDRPGHLDVDGVKLLAKTRPDMSLRGSLENITFESSQLAMQTQKPNSDPATNCATELPELVHSDVAGPMVTTPLGGAKYFLLFVDDFSQYTTVNTITTKSPVIDTF